MRQNDPLRISYDEASRLVELGADIDDLMNTCGISRPEAELVFVNRGDTDAVQGGPSVPTFKMIEMTLAARTGPPPKSRDGPAARVAGACGNRTHRPGV